MHFGTRHHQMHENLNSEVALQLSITFKYQLLTIKYY